MVVLAASIVSKNGRALVSRQFVDSMSRLRVEGLLAAFPKLVSAGKQHTFVETENVRYLYQPLENMYLLLVTNKGSNILEDLETLRLLGKIVPDYVHPVDEEGVCAAAFDLLFAFDEAITLGHREAVTPASVRAATAMDSHEEKLHKMIIQSKVADTRDVMKRKAAEIERSKAEARMAGMGGGGGMGGPAGPVSYSIGGPSSGGGGGGFGGPPPGASGRGGGGDGFGGFGGGGPSAAPPSRPAPGAAAAPRAGLQLGGGRKAAGLLDAMRAEGEDVSAGGAGSSAALDALDAAPSSAAAAAPAAASLAPREPVSITIEERVSAQLNRDGGLEGLEVAGTMTVAVSAAAAGGRVAISLSPPGAAGAGFQFKTHPNIDKAAYAGESLLALKDRARPFPAGAPLGVLKWRLASGGGPDAEARLPLSVTCWPTDAGDEAVVNIEYDAAGAPCDLMDVTIAIPAAGAPTRVAAMDGGDWRYDQRARALVWAIDLVDESNRSGSAEFVFPASDPASFFPVDIGFRADASLAGVGVAGVAGVDDGAPVKWGASTSLVAEGYEVV